ncbi:ABC transporter substrate-binding protein [Martelella sp. HB161492]|uniref:ABC transporter substrate-binding protein n=1 Tax=Martelella sp. HB161492 TaxID=2720726 RepID=UPI001590164D|nr:ABC transporter substrate-binding protein [Martelella sp. HB161492]
MLNRRDLMAAAALLSLAALPTAASAQDKAVRLQLAWLPNASNAGEFVALSKGYFADEGLKVEILPGGPSTNSVQEVLGGVAEIAEAYAPQIMYAADKGLPVKSFAATFQVAPLTFYSLAESNITSIEDWKGKRIGAAQSALPQINAILHHHGMSTDDITFVQAQLPALLQGQVDAVAQWPTNVAALAPLTSRPGGYNTQSVWDNGLQFQSNYLIVTTATLKSDPQMLAAFLAALDKGWNYAADHPEEAIDIVTTMVDGLNADQELASLKATLDGGYIYNDDTQQFGFGNVSAKRWQETLDLYAAIGEIGSQITADDVFDPTILNAAGRTKR